MEGPVKAPFLCLSEAADAHIRRAGHRGDSLAKRAHRGKLATCKTTSSMMDRACRLHAKTSGRHFSKARWAGACTHCAGAKSAGTDIAWRAQHPLTGHAAKLLVGNIIRCGETEAVTVGRRSANLLVSCKLIIAIADWLGKWAIIGSAVHAWAYAGDSGAEPVHGAHTKLTTSHRAGHHLRGYLLGHIAYYIYILAQAVAKLLDCLKLLGSDGLILL